MIELEVLRQEGGVSRSLGETCVVSRGQECVEEWYRDWNLV